MRPTVAGPRGIWRAQERAPPVAERGSPAAGALGRLTYELLPRIELTLNMIDIRADAN
jgi:hypothetical protein